MSNAIMEAVAVVESDRSGDVMQTWSFPELTGVPLDRCGLESGDDTGVLRFWQAGACFFYAWSEKVGKALDFTNADASARPRRARVPPRARPPRRFALVFSSRERHPARAKALMEEVFVPAYRAGGPMHLLQAVLLIQTSGKSPDGMNFLSFASDRGGAPPGTVEVGAA